MSYILLQRFIAHQIDGVFQFIDHRFSFQQNPEICSLSYGKKKSPKTQPTKIMVEE